MRNTFEHFVSQYHGNEILDEKFRNILKHIVTSYVTDD